MADELLKEGVYVIGFSFPVVPKGKARIRTQMSAAHTPQQIDRSAFAKLAALRQGWLRALPRRESQMHIAVINRQGMNESTRQTRTRPRTRHDRVKKPEVGHNDVLIKIKKTAICGTDIHIWKWDEWAQKTIPVPMHVGHEYVGEIVEMGQEVRGFELGDRVSGEGHITCGHCRNCRAGTPPSLPQHHRAWA